MKYLTFIKNIIWAIVFSTFILSCNTNENDTPDKELLVENLLTEYMNIVNNNSKYADYFNKIETFSKTNENTDSNSEEELLDLLTSINPEFLNLYNSIVELNLDREEFMAIANNYEHLLSSNYSSKQAPFPNAEACGVSSAISIVSVLGWLGVWAHCGPEE